MPSISVNDMATQIVTKKTVSDVWQLFSKQWRYLGRKLLENINAKIVKIRTFSSLSEQNTNAPCLLTIVKSYINSKPKCCRLISYFWLECLFSLTSYSLKYLLINRLSDTAKITNFVIRKFLGVTHKHCYEKRFKWLKLKPLSHESVFYN